MQQHPQALSGESFGEPTQPVGQPSYFPGPSMPPTQPPTQQPTQSAPQPPPQSVSPEPTNWVTFSRLRGHPLIDITEGKNVGSVHDLLLDQHRRVIQGFATKGGLLHGPIIVPAARATIGVDAVTFQPGALAGQDTSWLDSLPRASDLIGMRVHSNKGRLVGMVDELRIDPASAALLALELAPEQTSAQHRLSSTRRLLAANSIISYGPDTIVAIEGGISEL